MPVLTKINYCFLLLILTAFTQAGAQDFENATVTTVPVADGIYMLMGQGGNIGVSAGADGVLLIDDQWAPMNEKILAAIAAISQQPVKMVLNTHWHRDHTGGNELLASAGALIIAHDNVRKRMSSTHFSSFFKSESPPSPPAALPVVTFDKSVTLHINGKTLNVQHMPPAHTDGDSIVWFREANVVHLGDTFFNGFYPFIDVDSGGSLHGMIAAVDGVLPRIDAATRIMPGHGPLAKRDDLVVYRDMLKTIAERIGNGMNEGRSKQQIIDSKPSAEFDVEWGDGFIKPDQWIGLVYESMAAEK